jgi:hypothetical protein
MALVASRWRSDPTVVEPSTGAGVGRIVGQVGVVMPALRW